MVCQYKTRTAILIFCGLMLVILACTCGPLNTITQVQTTLSAVQLSLEPAMTELALTMTAVGPTGEAMLATAQAQLPTFEVTMPVVVPGQELRQWASSATASSEFEPEEWSATQATGAPNTATCEDLPTAWASGAPGEVAVLTLTYTIPVVPSRVEIHQNYNPGSITKIEVLDETGATSVVYEGQATPVDQCPYVQVVPVTTVTAKVMMVIITVDQSVIADWNEIDAVELIGMP